MLELLFVWIVALIGCENDACLMNINTNLDPLLIHFQSIAAGEGEDSDFEDDADLTVFDNDEAEGEDEDAEPEDEEMSEDLDEDEDNDDDDEEAAAFAEMEDDEAMGESTTFDYDLMGIKERLFEVGAEKETVEQNRRKVYVLYKAYQDFCPLEEDDSDAEVEGEEQADEEEDEE
jgi:hypothetical protein